MASPKTHLFHEMFQLLASFGRALGHPARLQILQVLSDRECRFVEICARVPLSRQTVCHHLGYLCQRGILNFREEANYSFYSIDRDWLRRLVLHLVKELEEVERVIERDDDVHQAD